MGRVVGSEVGKNRDGDKDVLLLKVEIHEPGDNQTVEYFQAAGEDFNPPEDTTVIVADLGEAWKIAIAADDGITPASAEGEKEIYSSASGVKMAWVHLYADGKIRIENASGYIEMNATSGQVDINGNFTVDP